MQPKIWQSPGPMGAAQHQGAADRPPAEPSPDRLSAEERRAALIEIAFDLLRDGGLNRVTMGAVAERAKVTRALVYKHFANREDLLAATFRSEAAKLDDAMAAEVNAAHGFEARLRTLVRAVLRAIDTHGWIFVPLHAHSLDPAFRREQRARDRRTVRFFAQLASEEFELPLSEATAAVGILLSGIGSLRTQARERVDLADRKFLEDLYVDLVTAAQEIHAANQAGVDGPPHRRVGALNAVGPVVPGGGVLRRIFR